VPGFLDVIPFQSLDVAIFVVLQPNVALASCACFSVELILLSLLLLLSETAISTKTLLSQSVILITRYKSGAILF
jgi:hypothetical protein